MTSVDEHLAEVLATIRPLPPVAADLAGAEGGVLAEDITASTPLPSFDNSAMDGYAVQARDIEGATDAAPVILPVTGEIAAGDTGSYQVTQGSCVRIMTGALLPSGADAVVPVEWTDGGTASAAFRRPAAPGDALRRRGDDVAKGDVLLTAGTRVGAVQLALLAAAGVGSALVRPRPRVAVISTGNELAEPGTPIVPGRIWDSNSFMLAAAAREAGAVAHRHRISDDQAGVMAAIEDQLGRADLLVTSGGVSMGGEHDVVKAALAGLGTITFRKVAMQPGMPQGFGVVGPHRTPIFTLPGNPVSSFVSFVLFVRPALRALQDLNTERISPARAVLTGEVRSPRGRRSFLRGVLDAEEGTVTPLTGQASHQLGALAQANALIIVPEQVVTMDAGDPAEVMRLP
jgi:molybdopterin molybdotransferase